MHYGPVEGVESQETEGQQHPGSQLHPTTELLVSVLFTVDDQHILEHEEIDEDDAGHHPDVQEGDVAHL